MTLFVVRIDDALANGFKRILLQSLHIAEETGERELYRDNPVVITSGLAEEPVRIPIRPAGDMLLYPLAPAIVSHREYGAGVGDMQHYSFNPCHW